MQCTFKNLCEFLDVLASLATFDTRVHEPIALYIYTYIHMYIYNTYIHIHIQTHMYAEYLFPYIPIGVLLRKSEENDDDDDATTTVMTVPRD